nr:hypothetical protein [Tanacetum cinerariifolium]
MMTDKDSSAAGGAVPPSRNKRDEEFTEKDNRNELADIQAINILSQGLSRQHALKSLKKKEQSSAVVDPLAYLAKTTPTHSTTLLVIVPTPQSSGDSHNDAMLATINQIANLLSGLQKQFPPTNNQLRTSSNPKTHATRARDSQWYHDKALLMQAKEKGVVLDAEAKAFLADVECTSPYDQPLA